MREQLKGFENKPVKIITSRNIIFLDELCEGSLGIWYGKSDHRWYSTFVEADDLIDDTDEIFEVVEISEADWNKISEAFSILEEEIPTDANHPFWKK
jgi:hypothetical protein